MPNFVEMRSELGLAISLVLGLASCAHRGAAPGSYDNHDSPAADRDVPSKRRGVITPSDPKLGIAGTQPTSATGTDSGHIDNSLSKGPSGAGSP
jgi:hypothetical protein